MFYNYKGFHSIVLQAVADSEYRFIFVDVGAFRKQGDAGTFAASSLDEFIQDPSNFLEDSIVPGIEHKVPYIFVCDDAYPLRRNMLKPYPGAPLMAAQHIFNSRLSRARCCVECSFGILANKWRLLLGTIETGVESACTIVKCLTVLHNIIMHTEGVDADVLEEMKKKMREKDETRKVHAGRKYNRSSIAAETMRQLFTDYFMTDEGSVPWQDRYLK